MPLMSTDSWYGLRTRSRFEKAAAASLAYKDYEPYLPCYRRRRRWSDRVTEIEAQLFPGYIFCCFDPSRRLPILTTPGVVGVLKSGLVSGPCSYLPAGQRIRIEEGALAGLEGVVVKSRKPVWRLIVSVTLLQPSVAVEIDREWARAIE